MSIYQSIFGLGDEHKPRCLRIKKIEVGVYQQDDSKPCTCGSCPLKYEGSHILPSQLSKREKETLDLQGFRDILRGTGETMEKRHGGRGCGFI